MANINVVITNQAGVDTDVSYISEIPLSLNFVIADIRNPDKRNATFSKTILLPGTKEINILFSNIFKLNNSLTTFDPRLKCKIKYYINSRLQLNGDLKLINITLDPDSKEKIYSIAITGTLGNLFVAIGDKYMTDLNFSAYNHALTKANVIASWTAPIGSGYVYGLINNGRNNTNSDSEYHVKHMTPQLYKRELMNKIFTNAGYTWTSTYLDSTYYKSCVVPSSGENITLSTANILTSQFYARRNATQSLTPNTLTLSGSWTSGGYFPKQTVLFNEDNVAPYNDAGAQYATGTGWFTAGTSNTFNLTTLIKFGVTISNTLGTAVTMNVTTFNFAVIISRFDGVNWIPLALNTNYISSTVYPSLTISNLQCFVTLPNFAMVAGEVYKVEVQPTFILDLYDAGSALVVGGVTTSTISINTDSTYYNNLVNNTIIEGATLEVNQALPTEVKQIDWVMSEFKLANLYMEVDPTNPLNYIIEPRSNGFYTTTDDWTNLLDNSKKIEIDPVSELDAKRYEFTYKSDADYFNNFYQNEYKQNFGFGYTDCISDFVKGVKPTEVIYAGTPLVGNNINGLILPKIYKDDANTLKPMKSVVRHLYYGGVISLSYGSWTLKSASGDQVFTTYPFVGDCDNPYTPTLTLNWNTPKKLFYNYINATYTTNNLMNKFYSQMISELSDKRSSVVKAWFNLDEVTIKNFTFRKKIYIGHPLNATFYVNAIPNYNLVNQESTLVELLKVQDYPAWAGGTSPQPPDPFNTSDGRMMNGIGIVNGDNNTNLGNNTLMAGGSGNYVAAGARSITLLNCTNVVVSGDVVGFIGIGLSNIVITSENSNTTLSNADPAITLYTSTTLDLTYNNKIVYLDASAGNITITWDSVTMANCRVYFVRTDNNPTHLIYITDLDATADFLGNALPYDLEMLQYDAIPITSKTNIDTTNHLYILS